MPKYEANGDCLALAKPVTVSAEQLWQVAADAPAVRLPIGQPPSPRPLPGEPSPARLGRGDLAFVTKALPSARCPAIMAPALADDPQLDADHVFNAEGAR
jgi:hypothetical protein